MAGNTSEPGVTSKRSNKHRKHTHGAISSVSGPALLMLYMCDLFPKAQSQRRRIQQDRYAPKEDDDMPPSAGVTMLSPTRELEIHSEKELFEPLCIQLPVSGPHIQVLPLEKAKTNHNQSWSRATTCSPGCAPTKIIFLPSPSYGLGRSSLVNLEIRGLASPTYPMSPTKCNSVAFSLQPLLDLTKGARKRSDSVSRTSSSCMDIFSC
ncbi:hypothetical protein B0H10DRAFT_1943892 [Mycena sp. CBHHK59/15]|nr:hypothetical protein B0H10DRAFT_1943892 [Mycena sp. CBHHK59/15]